MPRKTDHRITIRFTPEEYALIQAKAGDAPLGRFVREAALGNAVTQREKAQRRPGLPAQQAAQILALLGQSQHVAAFREAANDVQDGIADEDAHRAIASCYPLLNEVRDLLMQALGKAP